MIFELPTWNWGKINHPNQGEKLSLQCGTKSLQPGGNIKFRISVSNLNFNFWTIDHLFFYEYYKLLL